MHHNQGFRREAEFAKETLKRGAAEVHPVERTGQLDEFGTGGGPAPPGRAPVPPRQASARASGYTLGTADEVPHLFVEF